MQKPNNIGIIPVIVSNLPELTHLAWTPRHGDIVDGGASSFPLQEFALFFGAGADRNSVRRIEDIIWRKFNKTVEFNCFYGIKNPPDMLNKINLEDGYTLMWSKALGYTRMAKVQINQARKINPGLVV